MISAFNRIFHASNKFVIYLAIPCGPSIFTSMFQILVFGGFNFKRLFNFLPKLRYYENWNYQCCLNQKFHPWYFILILRNILKTAFIVTPIFMIGLLHTTFSVRLYICYGFSSWHRLQNYDTWIKKLSTLTDCGIYLPQIHL